MTYVICDMLVHKLTCVASLCIHYTVPGFYKSKLQIFFSYSTLTVQSSIKTIKNLISFVETRCKFIIARCYMVLLFYVVFHTKLIKHIVFTMQTYKKQSVLRIGSAHNKGGPPNINIV